MGGVEGKKCHITPRREARIAAVARGIVSGRTQEDLSNEFSVSQQQISKDWKIAISRWRDSEMVDVNEVKNRQLTELEAIKHEAWEAWWASLEDKEKVTTEQRDGSDAARVKVERETKNGDPRYLDIIIRCCEREAKLVGLDEAVKLDMTTGGQPLRFTTIEVVKDYGEDGG